MPNFLASIFHKKQKKQNIELIIFFIFILAYLFCLSYLSNKLVLSWDESYSLNTTQHKLSKVISLSYNFEGQPPSYFIVLSLWRYINSGIFFSRLLSVLFTLFSAYFLNKILKLYFMGLSTKWIIVLFLLNPFIIESSLEIRLYSMLVLLTLLAFYLYIQIYYYNKNKYKILFVFIGILGVYTQYYFVFLIISLSILLFISKGSRHFFDFCLMSSFIALAFLPNFLFIKEGFIMHDIKTNFTLLERLRAIYGTPFRFFIYSPVTFWWRLTGWALKIFFLILNVYLLFKLSYKKGELYTYFKRLNELFTIIISLMIFFTLIYLSTHLIYTDHYLTIVFPFISLFNVLYMTMSKWKKLLAYATLSIYSIFMFFYTYKPPYIKMDDTKSVAIYAKKIEFKDEPILFYNKSILLPFGQYYNGNNSLIPLPNIVFDHNFFEEDFTDMKEFKHYFTKVSCFTHSLLLITGNDMAFATDRKVTNEMLDKYINHYFNVVIDTTFRGVNTNNDLRIRRLININYSLHE